MLEKRHLEKALLLDGRVERSDFILSHLEPEQVLYDGDCEKVTFIQMIETEQPKRRAVLVQYRGGIKAYKHFFNGLFHALSYGPEQAGNLGCSELFLSEVDALKYRRDHYQHKLDKLNERISKMETCND